MVVAVLALAPFGASVGAAASGTTSLRIRYWPEGKAGSSTLWTLRCAPARGNSPARGSSVHALARLVIRSRRRRRTSPASSCTAGRRWRVSGMLRGKRGDVPAPRRLRDRPLARVGAKRCCRRPRAARSSLRCACSARASGRCGRSGRARPAFRSRPHATSGAPPPCRPRRSPVAASALTAVPYMSISETSLCWSRSAVTRPVVRGHHATCARRGDFQNSMQQH